MLKKTISLILAILMLAGALAGCASNGTDPADGGSTGGDDGSATPVGSTEEPMEISIATWFLDPGFLDSDDPIYKMVQERFNITIKPVIVTFADHKEKISTWMATGDAPDVFTFDGASGAPAQVQTFYSWVNEELVRPLPDDMSPYPNLQKRFEEFEEIKMTKINDKYWAIPRIRDSGGGNGWATNHGWYYRKDWAKNLGFDEITNYDELMAFLRAVKTGDPTGTGASDIIPIAGASRPLFLTNMIWRIFEKRPFGSWQYEDGELYRAFDAPHSYDAALAIREMFNEGLVDPDILITKEGEGGGTDKFCANRVAVLCNQMFSNDTTMFDKFIANNPDLALEDTIGYLNFMPNIYDGETYCFDWPTNFWGEVYIPASVSDEKYERIMQFLDFTSSDEWLDLFFHGIEGVDYERNGDEIVYLTEDGKRPNIQEKYLFMNGITELTMLFEGRKFSEYYTKYPYSGQMTNEFHDNAQDDLPEPTTALTFMINVPEEEGFVDESEALINKFMYSGSTGDPKAEWEEMLQALTDAGMDEVVAAKVEAVKAAGRID